MKIGEVRDLSKDQLQEELIKFKREHFNLRFQRASGQLEKTHRFRQIKRAIARIKTVMNDVKE